MNKRSVMKKMKTVLWVVLFAVFLTACGNSGNKAETGDAKVFTMKFDAQNAADGIAADWHPSEKTHEKAAEKLVSEIKEIMGS